MLLVRPYLGSIVVFLRGSTLYPGVVRFIGSKRWQS
jgi:hypothetical protein